MNWLRHVLVQGLLLSCCLVSASTPGAAAEAVVTPKRVPWTTSRVKGSPDLPSPYRLVPAFPDLKFKNPLDAEPIPGGNRMLVLEQKGKLLSFPIKAGVTNADEALDLAAIVPGLKEGYGLTFHPGFVTNRYLFLCYVLKDGQEDGTHVSRFTMKSTEPPVIDPASERVILTWPSGGHNGGCLKFGPDGCLYISTGDGAGPNPPDIRNTGQDISDLLASILRIDVDHPETGKPYRIPADNPFIGHPGARPEVWAYGLRNPWKMSFDPQTGGLWTGDVGWELWEMVYLIQRGGNYGWSVTEGNNPIKADGRRGPTPILPPVVALPHSEAASVTGGFFYYGKRLPELAGAYLYGDWATGKMWALRHENGRLTSHRELLTSTVQIITYALDQDGELYTFDYGGMVYRLEPNAVTDTSQAFPRRLSETGLFASVPDQTPAPGVVPYSINAEAWADHATSQRWVAFPELSQIQTNREKWLYPKDAVLAKTLTLEQERGQAASARKMETQLLHFDGTNWNCYSYRWNDAQTDATLVSAAGEDRACEITDAQAPGGRRRQTWRYHSRAECLRCHNPWSGSAIAYNFAALNKSSGPGSVPQVQALAQMGLAPVVPKLDKVPRLANPYDSAAELDARARAYLQVNCAHCHRQNAGGGVATWLNYELRPAAMNAMSATPTRGAFGLANAEVIAPGDPFHSVLYYRVATAGQGHMPHLGPRFVDARGVNLLHDWIRQLGAGAEPPVDAAVNAEALDNLRREPAAKWMDRLLSNLSGALALAREVANRTLPPATASLVVAKATASGDPLVRDLFEQFQADEQRAHKLGAQVNPQAILALRGDADRGRRLFFQEGGAQCQQCHRVSGQGRDFGPDLSLIGRKYNRTQLLDHIVAPSTVIEPAYVSFQVETKDELSYTGFLLRKNAQEIVLKDANLNEIRIPAGNLKSQQAQKLSAMPEGLLQNLTAQQAADLVAFLADLK
jgi:putative heme-binding domain-containing protein